MIQGRGEYTRGGEYHTPFLLFILEILEYIDTGGGGVHPGGGEYHTPFLIFILQILEYIDTERGVNTRGEHTTHPSSSLYIYVYERVKGRKDERKIYEG